MLDAGEDLTVSKSEKSPCTCSATDAAGQFSFGSKTFSLMPIAACKELSSVRLAKLSFLLHF